MADNLLGLKLLTTNTCIFAIFIQAQVQDISVQQSIFTTFNISYVFVDAFSWQFKTGSMSYLLHIKCNVVLTNGMEEGIMA